MITKLTGNEPDFFELREKEKEEHRLSSFNSFNNLSKEEKDLIFEKIKEKAKLKKRIIVKRAFE